ncbi:MAG: ABC transporter ATP-binding protein [Planctomycetes bacterium]|nr:ABC transporter ATP-binding protein [Planctomycetota bacterium]
MNAAPLLEVQDLVKEFPRPRRGWLAPRVAPLRAVDGVSFTLARGQALGLVGESGSGKTTVARLVLGLERASSGSIRLEGRELTTLSRAEWRPLRRRVQLVFQDPAGALDPRHTALDCVAEGLAIQRLGKPRERRLRALELLVSVGLAPRQANLYPHEFSGGQRQRIGIARALALEPELLVLDEPVSALDVSIRAQILNLLHELQERRGLAYLFIAHDLAVVRALCPRIAVMQHGKLVECASRDELFARPQHEYTRALLAAAPRAR